MSLIFERVLDIFNLNRFQPNLKQRFLRACLDNPKRHQGHQPQSGMSIIIIYSSNNSSNIINQSGMTIIIKKNPATTQAMLSIFERYLDAFKLNRFQPNFRHSSIRSCGDHPKHHQGHHPSQEYQNHHQLQPKIYKCHRSLRGLLMPSNSTDFNQILNIAPSGHV